MKKEAKSPEREAMLGEELEPKEAKPEKSQRLYEIPKRIPLGDPLRNQKWRLILSFLGII